MAGKRASIFDEPDELDVSGFAPKTTPAAVPESAPLTSKVAPALGPVRLLAPAPPSSPTDSDEPAFN